ncbi:MAG: GSCFA domain-containing protein [Alphaproteobacteria bacterium]|nr:GSCFA domain-containing protein [Alphaproteobacteria bacterium]MBV9061789.1 GSCFA domain-containing protein [Alphaproteobacteria bacterium]
MKSPYSTLPDSAFWQRSVAGLQPGQVDPVDRPPAFQVSPSDKVVTAGSCFAQHIARYLRDAGFQVLVTEPAHPIASPEIAEAYNYGIFSARYGNLYTARQLVQLFHRAYGNFHPHEDVWEQEGRYVDPFRPRIQPDGFASRREYDADQQKHFAAVRRAFEELELFVFTLGLTEAWRSKADGAVFPVCPGVAGGTFDPERHEFHNFTTEEVSLDLLAFVDALRNVNQSAKVLLTVSPVPLVATAAPRHVLVSTVYSKSVLRVATEAVCGARADVVYFPSYEIITGNFSRGAYFAPDCRSVTEDGVSHVMRTFFRHFVRGSKQPAAASQIAAPPDRHLAEAESIFSVLCEEEMLDKRERRRAGRRAERRRRRSEEASTAE